MAKDVDSEQPADARSMEMTAHTSSMGGWQDDILTTQIVNQEVLVASPEPVLDYEASMRYSVEPFDATSLGSISRCASDRSEEGEVMGDQGE